MPIVEPFPDQATLGEIYGPAMEITTADAARAYLKRITHHLHRHHPSKSLPECEQQARDNIGYWSGYYSDETASRALRLFQATHPIFGDSQPEPEAARVAGFRLVAGEEPLPKDPELPKRTIDF